jgi:threonylcarbamoyladenosine tRNA methylthiotransferase MtaB
MSVTPRAKFLVKTLGCKANYSDGQLLEVGLMKQGFEPTRELGEADYIVVNSCTVTNEADVQSQKMVRDAAKKNPNAKIIYTGCAAEVNPELALKIPGISAVIGNQNKDRAAKLIADYFKDSIKPTVLGGVTSYSELISRHPTEREWAMPDSAMDEVLKLSPDNSTYRTRVFIKIQEGCNSFCTYCIIPYGRGPARSLSIETILENIRALVDKGIQEVVLTGTNIGDFGIDWAQESKIDDLIEAILTQTKLKRLRVSSLDPTEISERMIQLMETHENFCPHFHLSLQNIQSKVLKLMKRKYSEAEAVQIMNRFASMKRLPFVGVDYIVGFPGETDEDFKESVEKLSGLYWSRLHVFPFSERSGTPATKLPNSVAPSVRKARARELQALSLDRLISCYRSGERQTLLKEVLLESRIKGPDGTMNWISGYAPNYQRVILPMSPELELQNSIRDIPVNQWVVDRPSGEVTWLGERIGVQR